MKANVEISKLIKERDRGVNSLDQEIKHAEMLLEVMHSFAPTALQKQSRGDSFNRYDAITVKKVIGDSQTLYDQIKETRKKIAVVDDSAAHLRVLGLSSDALQQLFDENESIGSALEQKYKEYLEQYSSAVEQQKRAAESLNTLRKERESLSSALDKEHAKQLQTEKEKAEKAILRKAQIKKARWCLALSALAVIAYRLTALAGVL